MKSLIILVGLLAAVAAYDNDYSKVNIEAIVADDALLKNFLRCFADNSVCTPDTVGFKDDFAKGLATACEGCTPDHKHVVKRFLEEAAIKHPAEVKVLVSKVDPENKRIPALKAAVANW